jgi:hypothetical protein
MKRITLTAVAAVVALSTGAGAGDLYSPLFKARLAETLADWESGAVAPKDEPGDATWWPVSLNPASLCAGSLCPQSLCFGSVCLESMCLGSGCIGSTCIASGCVASVCGVSGCAGTTLCLKKCGYAGGPPNLIDPTDNGSTFQNGTCHEP